MSRAWRWGGMNLRLVVPLAAVLLTIGAGSARAAGPEVGVSDDRVLLALRQEARAPFPKGYTLEQGDWSLLDAVRKQPPLWRDDRKELAT